MSMRTLNTGIAGCDVVVETSGLDGGDGSLTSFTIRPHRDARINVGVLGCICIMDLDVNTGQIEREYLGNLTNIESECPGQIVIQAHGDWELNTLRNAFRAFVEMIDEELGEQLSSHSEDIISRPHR